MQRTQQPVGLKYGYLFKCSQKMKMWDATWFVLGTQDLSYYSRGSNVPKLIDLQQTVSIVSADVEDAKRPHSFKLTSPSFPRPLILAAETSEQADEWIAAIRAVATLYAPPPESPNGPPKLTPDNRNMLDCTMRIVQSTGKLIISAAMAPVPGVYSKLLLDNLSMSALMCGTTGRVVVYKPKVQSGGQRFTQSVTETMGLVVKYKHTYQSARRKAGLGSKAQDPLADVTTQLESLIEVIERTVSNWMPNILDPELTKPIDDVIAPEDEEEREDREMGERGEKGESGSINPYVSPFFINPAASPPPCKKHWDLQVDECAGLIAYMEHLSKDENSTYRLPSPMSIDQAKLFLTVSRKFHEIPNGVLPDEDYPGLTEESFSLMKQQLLGSVSSIDYHTASIGLCADAAPPQIIDVISHAHGISSAITKLPRAIRKHRTKTLVSAIETIGSFSFSLSKLIMQMMDHESFSQRAKDSRPVLQDEVHAVQYIAIHMMGLCALLIEGEYKTTDILPLTDTAKLLALGVTNTLESLRFQLSSKNNNNNGNGNGNNNNKSVPASSMNPQLAAAVDPVTGKPSPRTARRKLESEIKDAATGSMVFWFGMVGQNVCVHLEA